MCVSWFLSASPINKHGREHVSSGMYDCIPFHACLKRDHTWGLSFTAAAPLVFMQFGWFANNAHLIPDNLHMLHFQTPSLSVLRTSVSTALRCSVSILRTAWHDTRDCWVAVVHSRWPIEWLIEWLKSRLQSRRMLAVEQPRANSRHQYEINNQLNLFTNPIEL